MISQWQAQQNALIKSRCTMCYGAGELDNAKVGSVIFTTWTCTGCGGSGFAPFPIELQPPTSIPHVLEG